MKLYCTGMTIPDKAKAGYGDRWYITPLELKFEFSGGSEEELKELQDRLVSEFNERNAIDPSQIKLK